MTAMKVFLIIFMIISSLTSIGTMSFVVYDVIEEKRAQRDHQGRQLCYLRSLCVR